jgi:hypothetical protein
VCRRVLAIHDHVLDYPSHLEICSCSLASQRCGIADANGIMPSLSHLHTALLPLPKATAPLCVVAPTPSKKIESIYALAALGSRSEEVRWGSHDCFEGNRGDIGLRVDPLGASDGLREAESGGWRAQQSVTRGDDGGGFLLWWWLCCAGCLMAVCGVPAVGGLRRGFVLSRKGGSHAVGRGRVQVREGDVGMSVWVWRRPHWRCGTVTGRAADLLETTSPHKSCWYVICGVSVWNYQQSESELVAVLNSALIVLLLSAYSRTRSETPMEHYSLWLPLKVGVAERQFWVFASPWASQVAQSIGWATPVCGVVSQSVCGIMLMK